MNNEKHSGGTVRTLRRRAFGRTAKICLLLFAAAFTLSACTNDPPEKSERDLFAMDTYMTFTAYGKNGENALDSVCSEIERLEKMLSVTDEGSEIFAINSSNGSPVSVSDETAQLIARSLELNTQTGGAFDITLYPVSREWGFTTGKYNVPDDETITSLLKNVGHDKITVDAAAALAQSGVQIDLGGIAKGYAGQKAADMLKESGIESALLNMGGNIQTVGSKPDGSPWKIGIKDPDDQSALAASVAVSDKSVITSGSYERFFEKDGTIYSHIIDPKSGYPVNGDLSSATVIGSDGALCDALSTSLLVMGKDKASKFLTEHSEIDAVLISTDHKLYVTAGIADSLTPSGAYSQNMIEIIQSK